MKKQKNLVLQTAVAMALSAAALSAYAGGTLTPTAVNFATENFGTASTSATEIVPGALTYTYGTPGGIVINNNGVINMYFRLGNGATFTAAPTTADFSGTAVTGLGLTKTSVAISNDKTTIVLTLTNGTGGNVTIGVGATLIWTPAATRAVAGVNTLLNTVGNTVGVTAGASVLAALSGTGMDSTVALPADVDGPAAASVALGTAKRAITPAVASSDTFSPAEVQKIDVTASTSQTVLTSANLTNSTTLVNFGSYMFTNVAGVRNLTNAADYSIAANFGGTAGTVTATGNFAAASTTNGMLLTTDTACTTPVAAGSVASLTVSNTTATWTGVTTAATATPTYVCMTVDGTTVIPATTPSLTATLTPTAGTAENKPTATGNLYALALNGATVDVRGYVPWANVANGYSQFLRVINTGTSAAAVTATVINADGSTGGSGTILTSAQFPVGSSTTIRADAIEAAVGALAASARPRIRISAPTSMISVQSLLSVPGGIVTETSGGLNSGGGTDSQISK